MTVEIVEVGPDQLDLGDFGARLLEQGARAVHNEDGSTEYFCPACNTKIRRRPLPRVAKG